MVAPFPPDVGRNQIKSNQIYSPPNRNNFRGAFTIKKLLQLGNLFGGRTAPKPRSPLALSGLSEEEMRFWMAC